MKSSSFRRAIIPGVIALAAALTACGGDAEGASGTVAIDGSSTVFPLSNAAYELLQEENPDIKATVGQAGTSGGFSTCASRANQVRLQRCIARDLTVTAYQSANGWVNLFNPTFAVVMGGLAIGRVAYDRWLRFVWPLLVILRRSSRGRSASRR